MAEISFFGEVDKRNGKIASEYPAWYFNRLTDELRDSIDAGERELERDVISGERKAALRDRVKRDKVRLAEIEESAPKMNDFNKDKFSKIHKDASKLIKESYFTVSQERKRLVDPYEEARRMATPCIPVSGEVAEACNAANVRIVDGKVSRDGLIKTWKLVGRRLGEMTNPMILKKE